MKGCGTAYTGLGPFRGNCEERVRCDWRGEIKNLWSLRTFAMVCYIKEGFG